MKALRSILIATAVLCTVSCEMLDIDSNLTIAERLEGRWLVEEDTPLKSTDDFYRVYIDISPVDSNRILIDNFYGINSGSVYADISGMTLNLPVQNLQGGFTIYGSAIISANYKKITWDYFVDDGSGIWEKVSAIYTKEEDY